MTSSSPCFLITGATGFLGRHLIEQLAAENFEFAPLLRDAQSWEKREWGKELQAKQVVSGGLHDLAQWQETLPELGGIFHLAAVVRHSRTAAEELYQANVEGTLNMVRLAAAKRCRLVFVSTSGTVGVFNSKQEWADEHSPYCEGMIQGWPYYDSKLKAEREARKLAQELGVELVIIRPPVLLGPGDHRFRSTGHIIRYLRRRLPFLIRGGMHFIDIRDGAAAMIRAMLHPQPQPIYHLSGVACSIDSFFRMVEKASGVGPVPPQLPAGVALALAQAAKGLSQVLPGLHESPLPDPVVVEMAGKYWDLRSRYAAQDLGFQNRYGQETINDTVNWLLKHHPQLRL